MVIWKYENMDIWKYGNRDIWINGDMEIWKYGYMEICIYEKGSGHKFKWTKVRINRDFLLLRYTIKVWL